MATEVHYDEPYLDPYSEDDQDPFAFYENLGLQNPTNPGLPYYVGTSLADEYTKNKNIRDMLWQTGQMAQNAGNIQGRSNSRAAEYERYRNLVGNYGNAQAYDQRQQDLASMLAGGSMGYPKTDVYDNVYGMLNANAGKAQQQTQQAAAQTGLNRVAASRLGRDAQYDYMRGATQKAQAAQKMADQQRAMAAADMLNSGITSRTGRGLDVLGRKNADAQATEDLYINHLNDALNHDAQRSELAAYINDRTRKRNTNAIGSFLNAGASGAAAASSGEW